MKPDDRARAVEALKAHIRVDAIGLSPAVVGHYVFGFDEALDAVLPIIRHAVLEEAAEIAFFCRAPMSIGRDKGRHHEAGAQSAARAIRNRAEESP